jgi:hypothetical protein
MALEALLQSSCADTPSSARPPGYARRRPEETVLHTVVREELETFLARARERDHPVPRFVEREFRAYLSCGMLEHGFVRVRCDACGYDRQQRGAGRQARRVGGVDVVEPDHSRRQRVDVRARAPRIAVASKMVRAKGADIEVEQTHGAPKSMPA